MQQPFPPAMPFVLIDDARAEGARPARLYRDAVDIIRADRLEEVAPALERLRAAGEAGLHAAGYLAYEAGYALEPRLAALPVRRLPGDPPLLWFGLFGRAEDIAPDAVAALLPRGAAPTPATLRPLISAADYHAGFEAVQENIRAGDIYQANFTFPCHVDIGDDPAAYYAALRSRAAAGHGALLFTGDHWLLSLSPELFFTLEHGRLLTRPMKGTALRDADRERDAALADALRADPKQRAENLMIVDLLRNDLSRIAETGSVSVENAIRGRELSHRPPDDVHRHRAWSAAPANGLDAVDMLRALFPCGSITGAPKIRAMELIGHGLETYSPRGPYTGAIGRDRCKWRRGLQRGHPHGLRGKGNDPRRDRVGIGSGGGLAGGKRME
jgi:para-aminobenzoate synthetase component 1